jgi:hypothetical protein
MNNEQDRLKLGLAPRRRRFKSCRSDHSQSLKNTAETEYPGISPSASGGEPPIDSQNIFGEFLAESEHHATFPKRLRFNNRGKPLASIYKNKTGTYTLYWRQRRAVDGKPATCVKHFRTCREAKRQGDKVFTDRAKNRAAGLTPGQATDAVGALKLLQNLYVDTGKRFSLLDAVGGYCGAVRKLGDRPLSEAIEAFLSTVATLKRPPFLTGGWLSLEERSAGSIARLTLPAVSVR